MKPSPKNDENTGKQQLANNEREPYQTPDIVYEGTISIRAGSPLPFSDPGDPFVPK